MTTLLDLQHVTRTYRPGEGIRRVSLAVTAGHVHALVGLNGAGKSTLLRMAVGMTDPHEGSISIAGTPVREATARTWAAVGHLVDSPLLYPELTVRQNLEVVARLRLLDRTRRACAISSIMNELHLEAYADHRASELSLGNRQRAGLAGCLLHEPRLVILDEPTNGLDPAGVLLLRATLLRRAADGAGILVSSHHLDEVARIADRISVLNHGRIIGTIDPQGFDIERRFFALVHADTRAAA
jgi:ABC-2 type transport system ATP-binding protein